MKIEKVFVMAALTVVAGALYAQVVPLVSPKSQSGLVDCVDDYMDVNSWHDVEFDKFLAHLGYNVGPGFNAGAATNVNGVYAGFFFSGNPVGFESTSMTLNDGSKYTSAESTDYGSFQLSSLIGFGSVGIRPSVFFKAAGDNQNNSVTVNGSVTRSYERDFEVYPELRAGFNADVSGFGLTPHAYFGVDFNPEKSVTETNGQKVVTDSSRTWILMGFGTGLDFPVREGSAAAMSLDADFDFAFAAVKNSSSSELETDGMTGISLGWTGEFFPADKVSIRLKAALPLLFLSMSGSGSSASGMSVLPFTGASLRYQASQKLALKLAAGMRLPDLMVVTVRTSGAGYTAKSRNVTFGQYESMVLEFTAGFRLDIVPAVTLDCGWSFGGNLLDDYLGSMSDLRFWGGVSRIFSGIQLGLSVRI